MTIIFGKQYVVFSGMVSAADVELASLIAQTKSEFDKQGRPQSLGGK